MAIEIKRIQVFLWKALAFPMKTCYNLVMKYPIPSFATILFFLLFMFLPLVFVFSICFVLVSALVVFDRLFFRADHKGLENVKGYKKSDEKTPIVRDDDMGKNVSFLGHNQTTRRRNVNQKDGEDYTHSSIENKSVTSPARYDDDLVDKTAVTKENLKELRDEKVNSADKRAGPSLLNVSPFSGVVAETEGEISDDSEEEDEREYTHSALDWSIDDQINLGHVSNSEIERDNKLEKIIARRKARKLLEIKFRNALMSPAINYSLDRMSSIKLERNNHFIAKNPDASPTPGSAPSVLLPMHNPLNGRNDLQEEKPVPESFQKEHFADKADKKFVGNLTEKKSTQENEDLLMLTIIPYKRDTPLNRTHKAELLRSLSSLAQQDIYVARDDNDQENDVPCSTDRILYEKTKDNYFFGEKNMSHAPSNSLASDLQVEVSEVSSPQSTSSNEKSFIFDEYINREATAGCEDMWLSNDYKPERLTASSSTDAPPTNDSEHLTNRVVAQMLNSENLQEASPQEVNVVEESAVPDSDGNESFKYREVVVPNALAEVSVPDEEIYCKSLEDTNTLDKHSYLNLSKASALISNEDEPLDPSQRKSTMEGIFVSNHMNQ